MLLKEITYFSFALFESYIKFQAPCNVINLISLESRRDKVAIFSSHDLENASIF